MVSYETIPADPAEDGLLATPKPKTSLKRVLIDGGDGNNYYFVAADGKC